MEERVDMLYEGCQLSVWSTEVCRLPWLWAYSEPVVILGRGGRVSLPC